MPFLWANCLFLQLYFQILHVIVIVNDAYNGAVVAGGGSDDDARCDEI